MPAGEVVLNVLFYAFAALAVGGAAVVAVGRDIVRSAFSLLAVLLSVAAMYAILRSDFLAAAQVLIYVGGILVLILFAVMLTRRIQEGRLSIESAAGPTAVFGVGGLLVALVAVILSFGGWEEGAEGRWVTLRERVSAGESRPPEEVRVEFLLFQPDGRTGLAWGGEVVEDRFWMGVRGGRGWDRVEIEAAPVPGWEKAVRAAVDLVAGEGRVELRRLPEGEIHWRARLSRADGRVTEWGGGGTPWETRLTVHRGRTRPLARALMGPYLFAFEAVSFLLVAALVGAAYLARKEVRG